MTAPAVLAFRARQQRRAVMARLAAVHTAAGDADAFTWAAHLRDAAVALGPVYAAFALYLGTRVDLLPVGECRALSKAPPAPPCWSPSRVAQTIARQWGSGAIVELQPPPIATTSFSQTHAARLATGEMVHVEVVTVDVEAARADLDLLPFFQLACRGRPNDGAIAHAVADFTARVAEQWDCRRRLPLAAMAARASDVGPFPVPVPVADLCSEQVFVTEVPSERLIDRDRLERPADVARQVVSAWLRQVIDGSAFAVLPPNQVVAPGRPVPTAGTLARLPGASASRLIAYLQALAGDLPDRAWDALAQDLTPGADAAPREEVARAFRCLVPFRDDRSCDSGSDTADHAFLQWRAATGHGWFPSAHLVPFYQGLFGIVSAVRDLAPGRDVLGEAAGGLRFEAGVRQFDEWSRGADLMTAFERQMLVLMQIPQKVDQLLSVAAEGSVRVQLVSGDERSAARRSRAAAAVALLLAVAGVILLAGAEIGAAAWSDPAQSIGFLLAGGLLVWAVGRAL